MGLRSAIDPCTVPAFLVLKHPVAIDMPDSSMCPRNLLVGQRDVAVRHAPNHRQVTQLMLLDTAVRLLHQNCHGLFPVYVQPHRR